MDEYTLKHFETWLERNELPEERDLTRKLILDYLANDPEAIQFGWAELWAKVR